MNWEFYQIRMARSVLPVQGMGFGIFSVRGICVYAKNSEFHSIGHRA
ncbi:MAG: hypothetical protein AAFX53_09120 [Bacteroidota bacterium]